MKGIYLLAGVLFLSGALYAQNEDPIKWSFSAVKTGNGGYEIHLTAQLSEEWHTYSQNTPSGGPVPTAITFKNNPLISIDGSPREVGKMDMHFEPLFGVKVMQYSGKVDFVQKVLLKHPVKTTVAGSVRFMTCNDHECLPPASREFNITLP